MAKRRRPDVLQGKTHSYTTSCGKIFITLNELDGELGEMRLTLGKSGTCVRAMLELIGILYSVILQIEGIDKEDKLSLLKKHCQGVSCGNKFSIGKENYDSCLDLIGRVCIDEMSKEVKEDKK